MITNDSKVKKGDVIVNGIHIMLWLYQNLLERLFLIMSLKVLLTDKN
jgi:hypothetical protein